MDHHVTVENVNDLLQLFLRASHEPDSEKILSLLIYEYAEPIITGIIKNKLRVSLNDSQGSRQNQDALEIAGDVRASILSELRGLKNGASPRTINNFQNYVAIKTYSACADYFRTRNPQRWRLRDLLRNQLKQSERFAIWEGENRHWLCGLCSWRGDERENSDTDRLQHLLDDPRSRLRGLEPAAADARRNQSAELLAAIFEYVGHPIDFNHLVTIVADVWGVKDYPVQSIDYDDNAHNERADMAVGVDVVLEQRSYLQRLWAEVCQLPPLQRSALLLNLRDAQEGSVIAFVPHLGIASKAEMAEVLSMSVEQFSQLWNELPLDDSSIAQLLGVTRQQVINLRKTGRERLLRRMKAIEKNAGGNKSDRHTA